MAPIDDIAEVIRKALVNALKDSEDELKAIAEAGGKQAGPGLFQDVHSVVDTIVKIITALPIVGDLAGIPLEPVRVIEDAAGGSGRAFGLGWVLGSIGVELAQPAVLDIQHYVNDLFQSDIFDPQTAAMLRAKGVISEDQARSEAAGGNLDGTHLDQLVDSAQERPAVGEVMDMWLKDQVTEDDVNAALQHHGIPQFWWGPLKAMRRQFLSGADLALANLRGVIDDTTMSGYARQLGIDANDMQVLIDNTGEPPGIMEMLFLYRRGMIDEAKLVRAIRQSRVRNEWVQSIIDLRYAPMTTADAARACVEGYLSPEDGARIAQENGLQPDHWQYILESWGRPLSHEQMLTLMHRGQATRAEVVQAMKESDIKDKYIDKAIELGRTLLPERMIVQALSHNAMTHDQAHQALVERGYNDADAEVLLALGHAERVSTQHALTRTDVLAMYVDSLLTRKEAEDHLVKLGYTITDANALLELQDVKVQATQRRTIQRGVEASLQAHRITEQEAVNQLIAAGVDVTQAKALAASWLKQRGQAVRTLTESQTVTAAADQIITPQQAYDRLRAMGYSQDDASILLELKGMPAGTTINFH